MCNFIGLAAFVGFVLTIPLANWLIGNVGVVCVPAGPCLIPVAPGVMAPSGVIAIGAALVLRDAVQIRCGRIAALAAVGVGGAVSWTLTDPHLALASVTAFLVSEAADMAVFTRLREKGLAVSIAISGVVSAALDSGVFVFIAFGAFDHFAGQMCGKAAVSLLAAVLIAAYGRTKG